MAEVNDLTVSVEVPLASLHGEVRFIDRQYTDRVFASIDLANISILQETNRGMAPIAGLLYMHLDEKIIVDISRSDITPEKLGMAYDKRLEEADKALKFLKRKIGESEENLRKIEQQIRRYRRFIEAIAGVPLENFIAIWEQAKLQPEDDY